MTQIYKPLETLQYLQYWQKWGRGGNISCAVVLPVSKEEAILAFSTRKNYGEKRDSDISAVQLALWFQGFIPDQEGMGLNPWRDRTWWATWKWKISRGPGPLHWWPRRDMICPALIQNTVCLAAQSLKLVISLTDSLARCHRRWHFSKPMAVQYQEVYWGCFIM